MSHLRALTVSSLTVSSITVSSCFRSMFAALAVSLAACVSPEVAEPSSPVGPVPSSLGLDSFYARHVDAAGLAVVGSGQVEDEALLEAARLVGHLLARRPDLRETLIDAGARVAVIAESEQTTDVPEHSHLDAEYWNERSRGLGGTLEVPVTSCGEENLLGRESDRYLGESILIHEFAHTLHRIALTRIDPTFDRRLRDAYDAALARGLWSGTYASTNPREYWAEGVQSWFDCNREAWPTDGVHNFVNTRSELEAYDPTLAGLIDEVFLADPWRWSPRGAHRSRWPADRASPACP